ncbi:MAG: GHMP kinase, partial [Anaerolineales bacterium]|nr:GHMP kinase [Anaerolineales bacterium]
MLSSAIDKFIFVIAKERFDALVRVGYTRNELVDKVGDIQHELAREALLISGINERIEVDTIGDIPASGSG